MPGQAPAVNLTDRTFEALRTAGLDLLRRRVGDVSFGDFVATGVVPAIIDVLAWFQEQNAHYFDRRRRNSYLFLADTRESMLILARAQGYRMRPATSASVSMQALPNPVQVAPITLAKGTRLTVGDLVFEVSDDFVIPANSTIWPDGTTDDLILLVEGKTRDEVFTSDGSAFQFFELGQPGTIDGSVRVTVLSEEWQEVENLTFVESDQRGRDTFIGDGLDGQEYTLTLFNATIDLEDEDGLVVMVTPVGQTSANVQVWKQVAAFTGAPQEFTASKTVDGVTKVTFGLANNDAGPALGDTIDVLYLISGAQKRYQLSFDEFDRAVLRFGNDEFGLIPVNGAEIRVTYRTGGGVRGNVAAGVIDQSVSGFLATGARTSVRVRNIEPGRGGEAAETVEHARFFAPRFSKSNVRAVTAEDWTALAATFRDATFGAPSHANAFLKQTVPELNTVRVALWGRDDKGRLSTPSTALKVGVKKFLDTKRTITTVAEMVDGVVVLMDLTIGITLDVGRDRETVFAAVRTAIERFFNSAFVLPGLDLSISRLYEAIQDVEGVRRAVIESLEGSVLVQLAVGAGDGTTKEFSGDFRLLDGTSVLEGSVVVTDGQQQATDDKAGSFQGDVDAGGTNAITYTDGKFTVTLASAPAVSQPVTAEARLSVFAPHTESLGTSDGTVQVLDGATDYYPIVQRSPRGAWARQQSLIVDDFRVGVTNRFRGRLPKGILPSSITIADNVPGAPILTGTDNGAGAITGPGILTGNVNYTTGDIDFEFNAAPALPVRIEWETARINVFLPSEFLPLTPGRVWWWVGFRGVPLGTQTGGADLNVFDDGTGNMVGDALVGGTISYETGEVDVELNAVPPPGASPSGSFFGRLLTAPDGVLTSFAFQVRTASGGGGSLVDLSEGVNDGIGRTRLRLSDLSTPGLAIADAWDNWQGQINGASLDREDSNTLNYSAGTGTLDFLVPLAAGTTQDFVIQATAVGMFMYSAWAFLVKTPGGPGLDKQLYADNNGRLWGSTVNAFPTDRLDHLRGRFLATLSGSPIASGRALEITYDALIQVPPALDVPLQGDQVASIGAIQLEERAPESPALGS